MVDVLDAFLVQEDLEMHPVALIFPKMGDEEFKEFKEDISGNGLLEPIVLFQDKILDGRNRYLACRELDIEVWARNWEGGMDPVDYVVSKNIHRRHLSVGQLSDAGLKARNYYVELAKERQRESGGDRKSEDYKKSVEAPGPQPITENSKSDNNKKRGPQTRDQIGEKLGVSGRSIERANYIHKHGTKEEIEQLQSGRRSLKTLEQQVRERRKMASTQRPLKEGKQGKSIRGNSPNKSTEGSTDSETPQAKLGAEAEHTWALDFASMALSQLKRIEKDDPMRMRALNRVKKWIEQQINN